MVCKRPKHTREVNLLENDYYVTNLALTFSMYNLSFVEPVQRTMAANRIFQSIAQFLYQMIDYNSTLTNVTVTYKGRE
jgi:hypothetical protein